MRLPFGFEIVRRRVAAASGQKQSILDHRGGWWPIVPIVREPYTGAWQRNITAPTGESLLAFPAIYACVTLIATDIGKMRPRIVQFTADGIWQETDVPAFSPILRDPNHFQNRIKFFEWWITSKLLWGNAYALKVRNGRGNVESLYLLDPSRVRPMVAPDGSVFYELAADTLAQVPEMRYAPAREMIHDLMNALFHPLVGVSPLFACAMAALQGLRMQENSTDFFANGSNPGGVITAPGDISGETAERIKAYWDTEFSGQNAGKVAVLGQGLKYEPMTVNANDAQLVEQLKWTAEVVCWCFHVPPHKIGAGPMPTLTNIEALDRQYYSQCLQSLIESLEVSLDKGLELPKPYGVEFDIDDLLRMDTATMMETAAKAVGAAIFSPDEARRKFSLPKVAGGASPYLQQQNYSLAALARRDAGAGAPATPAAGEAPTPTNEPTESAEERHFGDRVLAKVARQMALGALDG